MRTLYDIETGMPYEVTEEQYQVYNQAYRKLWKDATLKIDSKPVGKLIVIGTGGEISEERKEELVKLFYEPTNFKLKQWDDGRRK